MDLIRNIQGISLNKQKTIAKEIKILKKSICNNLLRDTQNQSM